MTASESGLSSVKRELKELQLLVEISQILDRSMDLREVVGPVLEALARHMEMLRGTLALVNRETGEISIDAAHGLSESQKEKGVYRPGKASRERSSRPASPPSFTASPRSPNS